MSAPREDLVNSAVEFLRNPQVANTPLEKKRAFLEYKKLNPAEIELAIARLNDPSAYLDPYSGGAHAVAPPPIAQPYGGAPGGFGPYAPLQPPRRDWRDWFIMATVTTGVGYGLYTLAKIEQDKAAVDANFEKAFALIEQLGADTAELKAAEEARTQRLDSSLAEVDAVVAELKASLGERERDAQRFRADIGSLRDSIPNALQGFKADNERRLADVGQELRSLKMLLGNRVGVQAAGGNLARPAVGGSGGSIPVSPPQPTGGSGAVAQSVNGPSSGMASPVPSSAARPAGGEGSGEGGSTKRSIPAWQMAAANSGKIEDEGSS